MDSELVLRNDVYEDFCASRGIKNPILILENTLGDRKRLLFLSWRKSYTINEVNKR